jgi:hypothetical protein
MGERKRNDEYHLGKGGEELASSAVWEVVGYAPYQITRDWRNGRHVM